MEGREDVFCEGSALRQHIVTGLLCFLVEGSVTSPWVQLVLGTHRLRTYSCTLKKKCRHDSFLYHYLFCAFCACVIIMFI